MNATYAIPTSSVVTDNAADHMIRILPNPFSESATIEFTLTKSSDVSLSLYNLFGKKLKIFVDYLYSAGTHRVQMQRDEMVSGVYLLILHSGNTTRQIKLIIN